MKDTIIRDAEEFGVHDRMGGWRLGLLVARNVEKGEPGRPSRNVSRETFSKVSAREFAKAAGTSPKRVLQYLAAWNEAADEGAVPHAEHLNPGDEPNIEFETLPEWEMYYSPVRAIDAMNPERRKAIEAAAAEAGTTEDQVNKVTSSMPALRAAIKADPKTREAAAKALDEHYDREDQTPRIPQRNVSSEPEKSDPTAVLIAFRKAKRDFQAAIDLVANGRADELHDVVMAEVAWFRNALDLLETAASAGTIDESLAALLSEEG